MKKLTLKKYQIMLLGLMMFLLAACTPHAIKSSNNNDLQSWIDTELSPYLKKQLGQHPRFKNEPFLLVGLDGENIQPRIDGLRDSMRKDLFDQLLSTPGVNLVWQPANRPWRHHRSLAEARCLSSLEVSYYIGIDLQSLSGGKFRVAVRALDIEEEQWVSGFSKSWEGYLTRDQQRQLQQASADEYVRGLRPLPFSENQTDLAAAYLARNLSCLIRERGLEKVVLYIDSPENRQSMIQRINGLLGNFLSQYNEVTTTTKRKQANVILTTESHRLHQGVYQLWANLRLKDSGDNIAGINTAVYMNISDQRFTEIQRVAAKPEGNKSVPSKVEKVKAVAKKPETVKPLAHKPKANKPVARKPLVAKQVKQKTEIIDDFYAIKPAKRTLCRVAKPWSFGIQRMVNYESVTEGDCLALKATVSDKGHMLVFHENEAGTLMRLWPSTCSRATDVSGAVSSRRQVRAPDFIADPGYTIGFNGYTGLETFHALAVSDSQGIQRLRRITNAIPDGCNSSRNQLKVSEIERELHALKREGKLDWKRLEFRHY